ncbi:hypothetical protein ACFLTH_15910 [Bacteroidota bacterium]
MKHSVKPVIDYWDPKIGSHYFDRKEPDRTNFFGTLDLLIQSAMEETGGRAPNKNELHNFIPKDGYSKIGFVYDKPIYTDKTEKYFFIPTNLAVRRVPQYALGVGVLGRTWPGTGMIEVLDGLYGNDFHEVMLHEVLHNIYPSDSEYMIRQKTKQRLPFEAKWN